jgi:hypothetical protein
MGMDSLWSIIAKPKNRKILGWIGGGITVVAAGAFTMVTYLWPPHEGKSGTSCAENVSIASQGDVSHATINANGATLQASGPLDCGNAAAAKH